MVLTKKFIGLFEIILILLSGIAFSYIMSETNDLEYYGNSKESKFISFIREKALNYLSGGLVSAQSTSIQTCLLDNNGSYCQEYPSSVCNSECTSSCFPGRRTDFSSCQLGTCFDTDLGLCSAGSPRASCENSGGTWYAQAPVQCNRGCCLVSPDSSGGAQQAKLSTSQECNNLGQTIGAPVNWDSQITGEIQCLQKVRTQREGACVLEFLDQEQKYNCQFTSEVKCLTNGGEFYPNQLCTNPQLNTKCETTENAQCFDDEDGLYFVDSCGNKANIYDYEKRNVASYWNSVVPIEQSCSLIKDSSGRITNEQRCGNCDYLQGSICGSARASLDTSPLNGGQYVCRDLTCVDEADNNKVRKHGESWCAFDSWTGLDGAEGTNQERAVDVPGSKHYRKLCFEGEIRTEPCAEYRNGVCVEQDVSNDFTNAQCRVNTGALCTKYNENADELAKCEESPDCYLKHVELDKFKFDVCLPKYPTGFELTDEPQPDSAAICKAATQTCTYYEKKNIEGRWECKINCQCKDAEFAQTMNNLCMSLGDCGSHVNLAGELGDGYLTSGNRQPDISDSYIEGLKKYITPKPGQRVDGFTEEQIEAATGLDFSLDPDALAGQIAQLGLGAAGYFYAGVISEAIGLTAPAAGVAPATVSSFGSVFSTAAVGAGIGYIVGLAFGLEGDDLTIAVVAGAVIGYALWATVAPQILSATALPVVGWIIAIVVAVIVAVLSIAGVGKYRERKVEFTCLPWQPPSGGDNCSKCSELGVECTAYKCASLGKTCELINPETENEACININPNDVTAPEISFNSTSLPSGYSFVESDNGVEIKSSASDGSIQEYTAVTFGIITNEPSQCKISPIRPENGYDDMENVYFDSSLNAYVSAHTDNRAMETLDELGASGSSADPNRRADYNLYVLCEDKSGNGNSVEYNIRFKVSPADDFTAPVITKFIPESPGVSGLISTTFNMQFYTNEPATCRFSSQDVAYEIMEGEANCNNGLTQSTLNGWQCSATLPVTGDNSKYYFRCADQPWLGEDIGQSGINLEEGRNANSQSQPQNGYEIRKTTTPLTISSIKPTGNTILSATEPVSVTLEIVTSGGIDNGKAFCEYSFDGVNYVDFFTTGLSNHKQIFNSLFSGNYDIRLNCTDRAGNPASGNSQFTIQVDNQGPTITRLYNSGNSLVVVTNEASICEYSLDSCSFEFETGTALAGASKVHTMPYQSGNVYKIKCKDTFGNVGACMTASQGY